MDVVRLTPDYELTDFDCGDDNLNEFLFVDAKPSLELRIANTFILEDNGRIATYFCLLNDKDWPFRCVFGLSRQKHWHLAYGCAERPAQS